MRFLGAFLLTIALGMTATCGEDEEATLESACSDLCEQRFDCGVTTDEMQCESGCLNMIPTTEFYGKACVQARIDHWTCQSNLSCDDINLTTACGGEAERADEVCVDPDA